MRWLLMGGIVAVLGCQAATAPPGAAVDSSPMEDASPTSQVATPHPADVKEASMLSIQSEPYGTTPDGAEITQYLLTNSHGLRVKLINFGATITAVETPDRDGNLANITLGFPDLAGYLVNKPYFGSICGRYANRIAHGKFTLDGQEYTLHTNNSGHHLHGGAVGFNKRVWQGEVLPATADAVAARFTYVSPDGEEGYPGELTVVVTYRLNDNNELLIDYEATTSAPTVLNLTNHAYWNLSGDGGKSTILDHSLTLSCHRYLTVDEGAIPTEEFAAVPGTPMEFSRPHTLGERIDQTVNGGGGYDHCYLVDGEVGNLRRAARVVHLPSGRVLELFTTEPGVQLYTGNFLNGTEETGGAVKQGGFCLEAQHLPNSPNVPGFPSTVLRPGETYRQTTLHRFSVMQDE